MNWEPYLPLFSLYLTAISVAWFVRACRILYDMVQDWNDGKHRRDVAKALIKMEAKK